ncbi:outer membrane receptor protein involved in Fe transport [Elusimicrobium posterum]|uniref:TonB-dependent receptor n=1 Tax=Elusimicrobium posterum TaxID=3116653 RepID=UPI003C72739F
MKRLTAVAVILFCLSSAYAQFSGERLNSIYPTEKVYKGFSESYSGVGFSIGTDIFNSDSAPTQTTPVILIDGKTIENAGYHATTDGLSLTPGIFIKKTNDFGRSDVEIRGLGDNGRRIAVMVDGRPDKMFLYGCAVTQTLPLNNVERVEVIEGPASALYGSGAMGGVINIITHGATKPLEAELNASYGSYNTKMFKLSGGAVQGKNSFYGSFQRQTSDGYGKDNGYEGNDFTVEYGRQINDEVKLFIRNKTYSGTQNDDAPVDVPGAAATWFDYRRGATDISGAYEKDNIKAAVRFFNLYGRHSFSNGWLSKDDTYGIMANAAYTFDNNAEIKIGAEQYWMEAERKSATPDSWNRSEYGLYTAGKLPISKFVLAEAAARFTADSETDGYWVPHFGLALKPFNPVEIYGTISKGIRFAQISELYAMPVSNPDLSPETVWGYETGARIKLFHDDLYARGAYYVMDGEDLIAIRAGKFENTGAFLFHGALGEIKYNITEELSASVNYSYLDAGKDTQGRPGQTAAGIINFENKKFGFMTDLQYIADYYKSDNSQDKITDIFTVNARAWYNIDENFQIFIGANNLLDRDYVIYATNTISTGLFQMPGITVFGGVKVKI